MAERVLAVVLEGVVIGHLRHDTHGRVSLVYTEAYRSDPRATRLSLALPRTQRVHSGRTLNAFLEGLLPDNNDVLEEWGRHFRVSPRNPFALLAHVGEDCAGAVQFIAPDALGAGRTSGVEWIKESDIAAWAAGLRDNPAAWLGSAGHGQFSLAGAQGKFALRYEGGRWGRPFGDEPTTHIVKPALGRFEAMEVDEHLCLTAARAIGLRAAYSELHTIGRELLLVLDRYDRAKLGERWTRIHQEDLCQASGRYPREKYEVDGGPSASDIGQVLQSSIDPAHARNDITNFADALAYSWVTGGTDAHAKNYSVLLAGREVRLAPFYDLVSILPYVRTSLRDRRSLTSTVDPTNVELAMKLGSSRAPGNIGRRDFEEVARCLGLDPDNYLSNVTNLVDRCPDAFSGAVSTLPQHIRGTDVPTRLVDCIARRARRCHEVLSRASMPPPRRLPRRPGLF